MENYLQKLLINQQNENILRDEHEQMIKRHERELEALDERRAELIRQRNLIIEEIQNFCQNQTNIAPDTKNDDDKKIHTSFDPESCLDANDNSLDDKQSLKKTIVTSKPTRTLKIITPRLRTSNVTNLTRIPESPTTVQIESMLSKVRNNVAIDPNTLNKCIDLLLISKNGQKKEEVKKVDENNNPIVESSSPKRRLETPEERRKRIEKVLFETPHSKIPKGTMSKSFSSLNAIDLLANNNQLQYGKQQHQQRASNQSLNRYSNRCSKIRRNHSLSPLRFGAKKAENNADNEQSEPTSPASILTGENSPKEMRKSKSEQQLLEKPLMSKEELNKIKNKKTMVKSKSIGWVEQTANNMDTDQSLNIDYLSHMRRSSVSPEQKQREKELNSLNNTRKFRCYQDFWENKTKEIMEKKDQTQSQTQTQPQQQQQLIDASKTKTNW
ncbi:hypothetical protein BLA29_003278 [Euroglyphus maynei]|uniref:Uncharacterized protein n=1 Tax=Euroglyphus maynei TaxID=6958 RepID=A0A1Y3BH99_EURMA|nr:hypothetical protein BLA29_003278 [Euroglyphus maynei]